MIDEHLFAMSEASGIEVVEAKRHHCGAMARRMRKVHRDILGVD
jgi:hypothetical protein